MIGAGPASTRETLRPRRVFHFPDPGAGLPILAALCLGFPGCTKLTELSEARYLGTTLQIDSNRVLASLVRETEYHKSGFMIDRDMTEYDYRYVVLDLADPDPPKPLESHGGHKLQGGTVEGNEVLLNPWNYLDLAEDRMEKTGFDWSIIPPPNPDRRCVSADMETGPGPGLYLVEARFDAQGSEDAEIRQWFVFDRAEKTYASLLLDSTGTVLDLAYRDRIAWVLHRIDSLTVAHRSLGPAAVERIFTLPDTLTEWEARVEYDQGPRGLFVKFKCGQCHPLPHIWYRDASLDSASWAGSWSWKDGDILNTLRMVGNPALSTVKVSRYADTAQPRVFDLSAFLR